MPNNNTTPEKILDIGGTEYLWGKIKDYQRDNRYIYSVKGTQTQSTNVWTGNIEINQLYNGLTIAYYLPYAGNSSNVTLNLTLGNNTTTGAIDVYLTGTTRLTNQYGAGSVILLTYWSSGSIKVAGTTTTNNRWLRADYDANTITTATTTGSGNAVTSISASNGALTVTKGSTFLTAHPTITTTTDTTSTDSPSHGGTFTAIDSVTRDTNGHVTKVNTKTVTLPDNCSTLATKRTIDGIEFNGSANVTHYGVCTTAADVADKVIDCDNFNLDYGAMILVKFNYGNSADISTVKLNVANTGAKSIYYRGSDLPSTFTIKSNALYLFVYHAPRWQLVGDIDSAYDFRAVCSTSASTGTKTVTIDNFKQQIGSMIVVGFNNTNTAATSSLYLKVNNETAKQIRYKNSALSYPSMIEKDTYYLFTCDSTGWQLVGNYDYLVNIATLAASTSTATYYPTITTASGLQSLKLFESFKYTHTKGTTSSIGNDTITLGNSTASGTASNEEGIINLYSSNTAYHIIKGASISANKTHTLPDTTGTLLNTGNVSVTPIVSTGNKIATITIAGTTSDIYATDTNTDTKVTQNNTTTNAAYRVLLSYSSNDTNETNTARKSSGLTYNPSTGVLGVNGYTVSGTSNSSYNFDDFSTIKRFSTSSNGQDNGWSTIVTADGIAKLQDSNTSSVYVTRHTPVSGTTAYDPPPWYAARHSVGLMFANQNQVAIMSMASNNSVPLIKFGATGGGPNGTPVADGTGPANPGTGVGWYFGLTGTTATTYNLDNFLTSHPSISTSNGTLEYVEGLDNGDEFYAIDSLSRDANGHVTGYTYSKYTISTDHVEFTRSLSSGTKIGTISINNVETDIYCNNNNNVTQTNTTQSINYRILLSNTNTDSIQTDTVYKNSKLLYNPGTGTLSTPIISLSYTNSSNTSLNFNTKIEPIVSSFNSTNYQTIQISDGTSSNNIYITPSTNNTGTIGHTSLKWNGIYATTFYGGLNGTIASSTTATTQSSSDNSTKVATTAFVQTLSPSSTESTDTSTIALSSTLTLNTVQRATFDTISAITRNNSNRITGDTKSTYTFAPIKRFIYQQTTQNNTWTGVGLGDDSYSTYSITLLRTGYGATTGQKNPEWAPANNHAIGLGISMADRRCYIGFNSGSATVPEVAFAAGIFDSTVTEPQWHFKIRGTSSTIYDLDTISPMVKNYDNATSSTGYLAMPFFNKTASAEVFTDDTLPTYINNGIRYAFISGTTSAVGMSILALGNQIASGTAKNKVGVIRLFSSSTNYIDIRPNTTSSACSISLPAKSHQSTIMTEIIVYDTSSNTTSSVTTATAYSTQEFAYFKVFVSLNASNSGYSCYDVIYNNASTLNEFALAWGKNTSGTGTVTLSTIMIQVSKSNNKYTFTATTSNSFSVTGSTTSSVTSPNVYIKKVIGVICQPLSTNTSIG